MQGGTDYLQDSLEYLQNSLSISALRGYMGLDPSKMSPPPDSFPRNSDQPDDRLPIGWNSRTRSRVSYGDGVSVPKRRPRLGQSNFQAQTADISGVAGRDGAIPVPTIVQDALLSQARQPSAMAPVAQTSSYVQNHIVPGGPIV